MTNANGNVKWFHFISVTLGIITLVVTVTICITTGLLGAVDRVETEAKINYNKNEVRITKNEILFYSIDKRLGRIEERLGIVMR